MADFLGITKRKWLAFGISSTVFASLVGLSASFIFRLVFNDDAGLSVSIFIQLIIAAFLLLVILDILLGKLKKILRIKISKRYLGAIASMFLFLIAFTAPLNNLPHFLAILPQLVTSSWYIDILLWAIPRAFFMGFISFIIYSISDLIAGLAFPSVVAKSKSHEKKSKN
ncbi:MAG: hypothetical protein M1530_04155 [Candidatus Marsarchaeota archaeon]|nr:hypothetical protein [Candidatus Marsarchaeota archaeon]